MHFMCCKVGHVNSWLAVHIGLRAAAEGIGILQIQTLQQQPWVRDAPTAAMDVNDGPKKLADHDAAFNMPAWAARTPGALPGRFARLGSLPKHKVRS